MRGSRHFIHEHSLVTRSVLGLVVFALMALPVGADGRGADGGGDDAYTMWGIFHHDGGGDDDTLTVAYLTGQRVQSNGNAAFGASYAEGSDIGAFIPPGAPDALPPGLHDSVNDVVVLIFRTHGGYDGRDEQIITGEFVDCDDCDDVQWACFLPGDEGPVDLHRGTDFCGADPVVTRARATLDRLAGVGIYVAAHTRLP